MNIYKDITSVNKIMYTCEICGFSTAHKHVLENHKNRKTKCFEGGHIEKSKSFKCNYCDKCFSHKSGKYRHQLKCDLRFKEDENKDKIIQELKSKLEELESKQAQTINNNTTNNNTINNNITNNDNRVTNITINAFGNENYDYIDFKELMNDNITLMNLIEQIHFNQDHPENWNVCINNMRSKYAEIYDGSKCVLQDKRLTIDKIIKDKCTIMIENKELIDDENRSKNMEKKYKEVVEYITSKQHHEVNKDYNEMFGNHVQKNNNYTTAYNKTEISLYNNKDCLKRTKELQ